MLPLTPESLHKIRESMVSAAKRLSGQGVPGTWGPISCRLSNDYMVITKCGSNSKEFDSNEIDPGDIFSLKINDLKSATKETEAEWVLHAEIYKYRKEIKAVIQTCSNHLYTAGASGREIPPLLDDMAQIIGPSIRVAGCEITGNPKSFRQVFKALAGRNAAILANHGAVCLGRDFNEALVTCEILEKSCRTYLESELMGGGVPVGAIEAWIMHQYFLRKYSRPNKA